MGVSSSNVDDYYSSISSSSDPISTEDNGKKKIKLKIKKNDSGVEVLNNDIPAVIPENHGPEKKNIKIIKKNLPEEKIDKKDDIVSSHGNSGEKNKEKKEETLNEKLEKESSSKFTVTHRSVSKPSQQSSNTKPSFHKEPAKPNNVNNNPSSQNDEGANTKFKPGFSKTGVKKPFSDKKETSYDDKKGVKKAKSFGDSKHTRGKISLQDDDAGFVRSGKLKSKKRPEKNIEDIEQNLKTRTGEVVKMGDVVSVKEFSEKIGIPFAKLIAEFMKNGMMLTINSQIDFDTASLIAESFEVKLERDTGSGVAIDDLASGNIKDFLIEDDTSKLQSRPPVISIMGHVDHGKTSLLDYIRKSRVASGEAGGITQSIGAYQVEYNEKTITFLDTPGHEAFTIMRARGAKSTDIAILVVAADEGVKPQTIESISHAKEAGIPVIVAINKMDKEGANPDYVKSQLSEHGLIPEDWGGDTPMVPVSAHTGFGITDLLEIILLLAEMLNLRANPERSGIATILESHLDLQLGPVATVLINTGVLQKGDAVVCAASFGKVKVLQDFMQKGLKYATPGMPALVVGLDSVAEGGDILQVVSGIDVAREKALQYQEYMRAQKKAKSSQLDILMSRIKSGNLKHLKIVVKADTNGSLEAIKNALLKLSTGETAVSIVHSGVGNITEGDVLMCGGSSAILIGFGVSVGVNARSVLDESGVEYIESKIIYHITERIEKIITGMLDPREVETILCQAKVGGIFYASKKFQILGLIITQEEATIEKNTFARVFRGDKCIGKGKIESLKQGVEEVNKLEGPIECGIKFVGVNDIQEKDIIEVYKIHIENK